jgi:ubiquinone biosynthesis protein COQ4
MRRLMVNPEDTRQVFNIFRALRGRSGLKTFLRFAASPSGQILLRHRPSLLEALSNRAALRALPAGSVGRTYLGFMEEENLSATGLVQASEDWDTEPVPADVNFFRGRMRDAHDLTHTLTGYGRDPLGELCLLAFMYAHTRNFGMAFMVMMAWVKLPKAARTAVKEAWRNGRKAVWFQDQPYEALLSLPLDEVRDALKIASPAQYLAIVG